MSIRIKLIIPAVAAFLVFSGVLHLYWAPRFYEHARSDFISRADSELAVLQNELGRSLLAADYSALYANLHYQEELHENDWRYLIVYDRTRQQIYPLGTVDRDAPGWIKGFNILLTYPLTFNGKTLGRMELGANWFKEYEGARNRILQLEIYLAITLGLLFLTQLYWEHRVITRPISDLNRATERLALGDFSAVLPASSKDEIGQLTLNFENMRVSLMAAQEKLEKRTREALEASRAKSNFVATMSHEIRTPMNGIIGMAQVLGNTDLNREQQGMVDLLTISCNNLFAVLNDVLDFSKIEAGKMELAPVAVNLSTFVQEACATVSGMALDKGISLDMTFSPSCPATVTVDGGRLRQVLLNLLSNSIKFTREGGVLLAVDCVEKDMDRCRIRFMVSDTGMGIEQDKQEAIFDAFTQADVSTTRTHGGTGLGLAISSRLVSLMGGTLELESNPGEGAVFSFELNLPMGNDPGGATSPPVKKVSRVSFAGRRLLLVEDNPVNQKVVEKMLVPTGIDIHLAGDGREALEQMSRNRYDIVLMDYQMPVMDGIEATAEIRIRERETGAEPVPIIALTANVLRQSEERCLEAGMDGFLAKPVTMDALMSVLIRYLS